MASKRKVIVVTDGDRVAARAVEQAANNIGARVISRSAGHPTPLTGAELAELVKQTPYDPVVVMIDDDGNPHVASGQQALRDLAQDPEIEILGAVAVASHTPDVVGTRVDQSITAARGIVEGQGVDKEGVYTGQQSIKGDTVDILNELDIPVIIGMGDPGKMNFADDARLGAPVTTKALHQIMAAMGVESRED